MYYLCNMSNELCYVSEIIIILLSYFMITYYYYLIQVFLPFAWFRLSFNFANAFICEKPYVLNSSTETVYLLCYFIFLCFINMSHIL